MPMAFTIPEVMMGVALMGIVFVSLLAGMSSGFSLTQGARENLRATQIMLERMEGIRLFNWNQLLYSNDLCPTTFSTNYYPLAGPGESKGITYYGTMMITNVNLSPSATYGTNMRAITVTLRWTNYYVGGGSNHIVHTRSMTTYSARNGIQNYIYNN